MGDQRVATPLGGSVESSSPEVSLRLLAGVAIALALLVVGLSLRKNWDHDEVAHLHSAHLTFLGHIPVVDFQARHHPLYYYLTAPLGHLTQDPGTLLLLHRCVMGLNVLGLALLVVEVGRRLADSRLGLWSAIFLLSGSTFVGAATEVRPDSIAVSLSILALVLSLPPPRDRPGPGSELRPFALAGAAAGLAVCMLQKAVATLGVLSPVIVWAAFQPPPKMGALLGPSTWRRGLDRLLVFGAAAAVPLVLLLVPYVRAGALDRYFLYFWRFNLVYLAHREAAVWPLAECFRYAPHLWILAAVGALFLLAKLRGSFRAVAAVAIILVLLVVRTAHYKQYLLTVWPVLALAAAVGHRASWHGCGRIGTWALVAFAALGTPLAIAPPAHYLVRLFDESPTFHAHVESLRKLDRLVPPGKRVCDEAFMLNVRHLDIGFNWFGDSDDFAELSMAAGRDMTPDRLTELKRWKPAVIVSLANPRDSVRRYVDAQYVQSSLLSVMVPGASAWADKEGRAVFDVWCAGRYELLREAVGTAPPLVLGGQWASDVMWLREGPLTLSGLRSTERVTIRFLGP